jgi:hypothetical protein
MFSKSHTPSTPTLPRNHASRDSAVAARKADIRAASALQISALRTQIAETETLCSHSITAADDAAANTVRALKSELASDSRLPPLLLAFRTEPTRAATLAICKVLQDLVARAEDTLGTSAQVPSMLLFALADLVNSTHPWGGADFSGGGLGSDSPGAYAGAALRSLDNTAELQVTLDRLECSLVKMVQQPQPDLTTDDRAQLAERWTVRKMLDNEALQAFDEARKAEALAEHVRITPPAERPTKTPHRWLGFGAGAV